MAAPSKTQKNPAVAVAVILLAIIVLILRFEQINKMLGTSAFCDCNCNRNCNSNCRRYLSERDNFSPDNPGACAKTLTSEKWAAGLENDAISIINGY